MATRVTLKLVNDELARLGYTARLAKGSGYFYFQFGEAADWLDRTVHARTMSGRTLKEWIDEFHRLKNLNQEIMEQAAEKQVGRKRGSTAGRVDADNDH
jgi:hypothetical protein